MLPLAALTFRSCATEQLTDVEFEVLMVRIRAINGLRGVTGVLIRRGAEMVEYIEGEPHALKVAYERIERSEFHTDVTVLERATISDRAFESFHEGFFGMRIRARHEQETERLRASLPAARAVAEENRPVLLLLEIWDAWSAG